MNEQMVLSEVRISQDLLHNRLIARAFVENREVGEISVKNGPHANPHPNTLLLEWLQNSPYVFVPGVTKIVKQGVVAAR